MESKQILLSKREAKQLRAFNPKYKTERPGRRAVGVVAKEERMSAATTKKAALD